ncbi:hypothetical protein Leryth_014563 [Lithospermum erythrorhizon]|nr:hypothetical protein Leryth_014563 [Lithospermum erythrorhizon]
MDNDLYLSSDDKSFDHVYDYYDDGYDDNDDEFIEEPDDADYVEEQDKVTEKVSSCKVITKESLMAAQKNDLQRVMDLLLVKEHYARTLLIHFRWDAYKIVDILFERGKEWLFSAAGVPMAIDNNVQSSLSVVEVTCEICYDDVPVDETTIMDCGHRFCNNCKHFT